MIWVQLPLSTPVIDLEAYVFYANHMNNLDKMWLAGLLEGEGSFLKGSPSCPHRPRVCLQMTDKDVVDRAAKLMGGKGSFSKQYRKKNPKWKPVYQFAVTGRKAVDLMNTLFPLMGQRRQQQIQIALACFEERRKIVSAEMCKQIRSCWRKRTLTQAQIGDRFGLCRETINKIVNRKGRYKIT